MFADRLEFPLWRVRVRDEQQCSRGLRVYDNIIIPRSGNYLTNTINLVSQTTPIRFAGNLFLTSSPVVAGQTGEIIDDGYNRYIGQVTANTNVSAAATSIFSVAGNLVLPHLVKWGLEMPRSDFLGWTDAAHADQKFSAYARTTADHRGRTVRPWGAGSSIGCWQAQDVVQDTTSAITGGGTNSLKLTGAGEVSLYIPVDATGFTVSITTKSTSYGGTAWPQMIVVANPSIGVASGHDRDGSSSDRGNHHHGDDHTDQQGRDGNKTYQQKYVSK